MKLPDSIRVLIIWTDPIDDTMLIDLGAVTFEFEGREFIWDTETARSEGMVTDLLASVDKDVFPDCNYDLVRGDISKSKRTLFVGGENIPNIDYMDAFLVIGSTTLALSLELD